MDGWGEWVHGWMDGWMDEYINEWMSGWASRKMGGGREKERKEENYGVKFLENLNTSSFQRRVSLAVFSKNCVLAVFPS